MRLSVIVIYILMSSFSLFSQRYDSTKVEVKKLAFNTSLSEISCAYNNGNLIYFQNKPAHKSSSQYYDLFRLDAYYLDENTGNVNKISLTEQISGNTFYHEGPCFIDEINEKIYITVNILDKKGMRSERRQKVLKANRLKIVEGDYKDGVISNLKEFKYNDPMVNVGHATYSHETNRLYFASTQSGTFGKSDIFYCEKKVDGSWDNPKHLLSNINSKEDELFPQVKNGILYFASNGQKKQIGSDLDIFYIEEDKITSGGRPHDLKQLNSDYDDFSICFSNEKNKLEGYFTSNRDNKFSVNDDIYFFSMDIQNKKDLYEASLEFIVNGKNISQGNVVLLSEIGDSIESKEIKENSNTNFKGLTRGEKYKVALKSKDYSSVFDMKINKTEVIVNESFVVDVDTFFNNPIAIDKNKIKGTEKELIDSNKMDDIKLNSIIAQNSDSLKSNSRIISEIPNKNVGDTSKAFVFNNENTFESIYFAFDSYIVTDYSKMKLDSLILYASETNAEMILIQAYTDSRGSNSYNKKLSVKRALACKKYLIENGIDESRIKYIGLGEANKKGDCGDDIDCPESVHQKNRRIDFAITY